MVVVVVVVVVWWRPHLHRHQWIVPEYIRTLDSTGLDNRPKDGSEAVSLMRRPRSTPQIFFFCFWYSFLLEAQ
jgi:hypothetical protein